MRFLFGVIVGAALTIGAAYIHDTSSTRATTGQGMAEQRPIVNWGVVERNVRLLQEWVTTEWRRITAG